MNQDPGIQGFEDYSIPGIFHLVLKSVRDLCAKFYTRKQRNRDIFCRYEERISVVKTFVCFHGTEFSFVLNGRSFFQQLFFLSFFSLYFVSEKEERISLPVKRAKREGSGRDQSISYFIDMFVRRRGTREEEEKEK